jgi:hypothetical protein
MYLALVSSPLHAIPQTAVIRATFANATPAKSATAKRQGSLTYVMRMIIICATNGLSGRLGHFEKHQSLAGLRRLPRQRGRTSQPQLPAMRNDVL